MVGYDDKKKKTSKGKGKGKGKGSKGSEQSINKNESGIVETVKKNQTQELGIPKTQAGSPGVSSNGNPKGGETPRQIPLDLLLTAASIAKPQRKYGWGNWYICDPNYWKRAVPLQPDVECNYPLKEAALSPHVSPAASYWEDHMYVFTHPLNSGGLQIANYDPIFGLNDSGNIYDLSFIGTHQPSAVAYEPLDYRSSIGGGLMGALLTQIRSLFDVTTRQMENIHIYLLAKLQEAAAPAYLMMCYKLNLWPSLLVNSIKSDAIGTNAYSSLAEVVSEYRKFSQQNLLFPQFMLFWMDRFSSAITETLPNYPDKLFIPWNLNALYGILRTFNAFDASGNQWANGDDWLATEGLEKLFRTDVLPKLFGKQPWQSYYGLDPYKILETIGWNPVSTNFNELDFLKQQWYLTYTTDTGAQAINSNPTDLAGSALLIEDWLWQDVSAYSDGNSLTGKSGHRFWGSESALSVASHWRDPAIFNPGTLYNYATTGSSSDVNIPHKLGLYSSSSVLTAIPYQNVFQDLFDFRSLWYGHKLSWVDPTVNRDFDQVKIYERLRESKPTHMPFSMPRTEHFVSPRTMIKMMASGLGLNLKDVREYDVQRTAAMSMDGTNTGGK
jgi:hypothetical protein